MLYGKMLRRFNVIFIFICNLIFSSTVACNINDQLHNSIINCHNEEQICSLYALEEANFQMRDGYDESTSKDEFNLNQIIISIGQHCEVASQIYLRTLGTAFFPFDWINSMDFESICEFISNDFKTFLDIKNLELKTEKSSSNHLLIFDKKYNILFPHDFPMNQTISQSYETVINKYKRRIERFFKALKSDKHVYFVRKHLTKEQSVKFVKIIKKKYPKLKFTLVAVNNTEEFKKDWNLANIRNFFYGSKNPAIVTWEGDKDVWDGIFKSLGIEWDTKQP